MEAWKWQYVPSDLADWFDAESDKYWAEHDEWLAQSLVRGEARPAFVLAAQFSDRVATGPRRIQHVMTSGVVDLLRLGSDLDFSAGWDSIAKGALLNVLRLAMVVGPASAAVGAGRRFAGLLATSRLSSIPGATGPCAYVSINNVLSFLKAQRIQLFATVDDIIAVASANKGMARETLLAKAEVVEALQKHGVETVRLLGFQTIDDVLRAARATDRPIVFSIRWTNGNKIERHALTAVRDAQGQLRILDYVAPGVDGFRGFASLAEMAAARPQWGSGFLKAELRTDAPVMAFSTRWLRLLEFADGSYRWGLPVSMGVQWVLGRTVQERLESMAHSAWRFLKQTLGDEAPTPPSPTRGASPPAQLHAPSGSTAPRAGGLGVAPLAAEAAGAPRIDWLTGVQYRLRFLGYYRGTVHGTNDEATKSAVLAFQTQWFSDPKEWDAIPGPVTQAMLHAVVGW